MDLNLGGNQIFVNLSINQIFFCQFSKQEFERLDMKHNMFLEAT